MQLLLAVSMVKSDSARRGWQERVGFLFSGTEAISLSVHGWSWLWYFALMGGKMLYIWGHCCAHSHIQRLPCLGHVGFILRNCDGRVDKAFRGAIISDCIKVKI
jgi:hypothetical protein